LDRLDPERHLGDELVEEGCGGLRGRSVIGFGDGPFGDRAIGGEVLDRLGWGEIDEQGVELDEAAGLCRLDVLGQALGEASFGGPAAGMRPLAQGRHGLHDAAIDERADHAADGGVGGREAFRPHERPDLGPAPHREVLPQSLDRPDQFRCPGLLAHMMGPTALRFETLSPAVKA